MNTKKLLSQVLLLGSIGYLGIHATFAAENEISNRETIHVILQKQSNGETLTTEEQALLIQFESNRTSRKTGSGMTLSAEQQAQMEQMQVLRDKQSNGKTLTTEEQALLTQFESNRTSRKTGSGMTFSVSQKVDSLTGTTQYPNLKSSYKTKIDASISNIENKIQNLSDEQKISTLETLSTRISKFHDTISQTSSYKNGKQAEYDDLVNYFSDKIQSRISDINENTTDNETQDFLNELFSE